MTTYMGSTSTDLSNFTFTSSVSGYSLYGFADRYNTTTRDHTNVGTGLAYDNCSTTYAILYKTSGSNTYYTYCTSTTVAKCTEPDGMTSTELGAKGMIGIVKFLISPTFM